MSLRSRSYVKASMVLTRADHLFIHNYIGSILNNIVIPILMVRTGLVVYVIGLEYLFGIVIYEIGLNYL